MIRRAGLALALGCLGTCLAQEAPAKAPLEPGIGDQLEELRAAAFAPARLKGRRERLLASLPKGAVVVVGSTPVVLSAPVVSSPLDESPGVTVVSSRSFSSAEINPGG